MTGTGVSSQRTYQPTSGAACIAPSYAADLEVLRAGIAGVIAQAKAVAGGLTDAQFNWKPSPDRWSVAQCLKHLALTGGMAAANQETAIGELRAKDRRSDGPYSYRGLAAKMGNMLMKSVEPPVQKKFKTAKKVFPAEHHDRDALLGEFVRVHERLGANLDAAKGLDVGSVSVGLPVPLFRIALGQSLAFEIAHARRHLWQAEQVRAAPGFPS
jgi:hypothetical protein